MKLVALTGSIGSGKSAVLNFVSKLRVPVVDCDRIVAGLYRENRVRARLRKAFGTASKEELASIAFSSPGKRRALEKILHPLVWKAVRAKLSSFRTQGKALAFVDVPLLFEAGWQGRFDAVVLVKAPKHKCISRLRARGLSRKDALKRWKAQFPQRKKVKSSGYVIDNGGPLPKTRRQVKLLVQRLVE